MRGRHLALFFSVFALIWLTSCGASTQSASWFGVSSSDDTVYLAANQHVFAVNLESGAELWRFPLESDTKTGPFFATPLLTGDTAIVGSFGDGQLYSLSRERGVQDWVVETEATIVAGARSTNYGIVVGNGEGEVFLVDPDTQEKRLLMKADEPIWATPLVDEAGERVFVASMDHHVYAVDLASGEQRWVFDAGGALVGTPALSDDVLYFGTLTSSFFAIGAKTGEELWRVETDGWVWGGPLVVQDTVYFGDMTGKVYALNAAGGSQRWIFEAEEGVGVTPVLSDGILFFGARGGQVYAVRVEDGSQKWSLPLDGSVYSQPVLRDDHLLISPHKANVQLVALDSESGAEIWSFSAQEE